MPTPDKKSPAELFIVDYSDSDWFRNDDDVRWQYGVPPRGKGSFAWVQHFIHVAHAS